jgi:Xaa-Pro aminopeptidase
MENRDRTGRLQSALRDNQLDLLVCALPSNVLMLSGYWPVVGTGIALASGDSSIKLLIPEDESDLARDSWADEVRTFHPGSLGTLESAAEAMRAPLRELLGAQPGRIGLESGEASEPASYAAIHLYGASIRQFLTECFPQASLNAADEILSRLRAVKTPVEIERIRTACRIAESAFERVERAYAAGASELEVAAALRSDCTTGMIPFSEVQRVEAFAWCMSGANSALAGAAYARSHRKHIANGDLILVHCNSCADGYWTDITRTFCAGEPDDRQRSMFDAVAQARRAALAAIRPGVRAAEVDRAAREVLEERGFGAAFTHSTGHGVGFGAISANALPRLHPLSPDVLESGMVFNVEPAVYVKDYGGIRHCDMVAVTEEGHELLTPSQCLQSS